MKSTDIVQPHAMPSIFAEDVYSASGTTNFAIPDATSTSATDTCVMDDGFLPITSEPLDDGGIAPERKNFNGLFYLSTDLRVYLQNGGVITYNSDVATAIGGYPAGAVLDYINNGQFKKVQSLIDDNTNNFISDPSLIDGTHWQLLGFGIPADYANQDLSNLTTTGQRKILPTQSGNSNKYLTTNGTSPYWTTLPSNIPIVDWSAGVDVTSTAWASSGTGYKPSTSGILLTWGTTYQTGSYKEASLYVYNTNGTLVAEKFIAYTNGATGGISDFIPVSPNFSYRTDGWHGGGVTRCFITFFPYY